MDGSPGNSCSRTRPGSPEHLEALLATLPDASAPVAPRERTSLPARAKQIKSDQAREIVTAYEAGATVYDLGRRFGIARQTVSTIRTRHSRQLRRTGRSPEQINEAARLYVLKWSLARIGRRMEVIPDTVRLLERRVRMRDRNQRFL
ncbi:hypothetical protein RIF23_13080 [Lipingzhangella sp. LS1_29]|uniref:Uncharacterized protein n=1 Tax=Lipingzhangella rawalii TaxID=2055835 RepID=A0ABU2H7D5_9ACTN|nr:hypothetical protein [Lipingzhangella rawalii]MDS1271229.1 hypothetical protein [Lipingzhangella rawalii]